MKSFEVFVDSKKIVWRRDRYIIRAENKEQAVSLIKDQFEEDEMLEESDIVEFQESELLYETEEDTGEIEVYFEQDKQPIYKK